LNSSLRSSFISPPSIPGTVSTGLISPFTYTCTRYLYHIHPPTPFPHIPLHGTNPPDSTCLDLSSGIKKQIWLLRRQRSGGSQFEDNLGK
jgi:hypothetical protein